MQLRDLSFDLLMGRILLTTKEAPILMANFENEAVDAWRQFLAKGDIEDAFRFHQSKEQRLYLAGLWGDQLFAKGKHQHAAKLYVESDRSFEETSLKFMRLASKQGDASLEKYQASCLEKLNQRSMGFSMSTDETSQALFNKERTQRTVLATLLLEIKLSMLEDA